MTSSANGGPTGAQRPRIDHRPLHKHSTGPEAIELAATAGLILDDWQQYLLTHWLGETEDGQWSSSTVGLMVSRQNGKGALLEARELAALFLLEEPVIVHTAHLQDTANVHFRRLVERIEGTPELKARLAKPGGILRGRGTETIQLAVNPETGLAPRIEVRTRTGSGGLGFSINCLVFDEAMIISDAMHQALIPTVSAQSIDGNLQLIYTGSAVDETNPSHQGVPFARIREQGLSKAPGMMYSEWSLDIDDPAKVNVDEITSEDLRRTNPGLGLRIGEPYIRQSEMAALGGRGTAVQRLGVGAWPRTDGLDDVVITPEAWGKCLDREHEITGAMCFALDVDPIRAHSSVGVAGFREDDLVQVELMEQKRGTGWVVDYVVDRVERHKPQALLLDGMSGAFALLPDLTEALKARGLLGSLHDGEVTVLGSKEHGQACGMFFDAVDQITLRHRGQPEIAEALRGAIKSVHDPWRWSRKNSTVNITPLVTVTLAYWGIQTLDRPSGGVVDVATIWTEMQEAQHA